MEIPYDMFRNRYLVPLRKILNILSAQNEYSVLEVEESIWERLRGAYILRGSTIKLLPKLVVQYDLFSELTCLIVVSRNTTRQWGTPDDISELSNYVVDVFTEGIIVVNHDDISCRWVRGSNIMDLDILQSLRRVATSKNLFMLAKLQQANGIFVFAHVQAKLNNKNIDAIPWLRDFLVERAIHIRAPFAFPISDSFSRMSNRASELEE